MTLIPTIFGYDATAENEHLLPVNVLAAGYDTGSSTVIWSPSQFARHTHPYPAIHYDQDPNASDPQADLLDVEARAATPSEIISWLYAARLSYTMGHRPGQRWPGVYTSFNNVTSIVGSLSAMHVSNVPFVVADYNITEAEAIRRVSTAIGSYPAVGYQYTDQEFGGLADGNIFSVPWVTTVSKAQEDDMPNGQLYTQEFIPFPKGKYTRLFLYRDFIGGDVTSTVRIAVHSATLGYSLIDPAYTLNAPVPVEIIFTAADVNAVSIALVSGASPVGYALA